MIIIASIIMAVVCIVPAVTVPVVLHARHSHHSQSEALSNGLALRIMPLGASITWGTLSTDGNGYRNDLRTNLTTGGNAVNMVGSRKHGTMADSDNEGWPGYVIDQVHDKARTSVPKWKPNVILVNAGTNDCLQNRNVTHAADRMRSMIDDLLVWSPRATIVLSTLIVNKDNKTEARVESVNEDYRALAGDLQANGTHLVLAEMHGSDGPQLADMADQTHPNDTGYAKMAAIWYAALREASNKDWLQQAENVGIPDNGGS
ncbi:Lipase, gdsl [Pleurostoma richardsiae]|uniref:Lipase, gdsl n=1 Tax=Pleurostoma richardsiae TaxID=41990 RepID=A0AA38VIU6_9PEZI|nr:Lipase, gdsl [Pleurostoma richardsiae]